MKRTITDEEAQEFIDSRRGMKIPGMDMIAFPDIDKLDPAKVKVWLQKCTDEADGLAFSFTLDELKQLEKDA